MPKKQNGFGKAESFAFKDFGRIDKGKAKGAAGLYPSNRRYGSSVHRSVIEKYDLDSDWVKWRKGFEYANKTAWYLLETANDEANFDPRIPINTDPTDINYNPPPYNSGLPIQDDPNEPNYNVPFKKLTLKSILYQGTEYEIDVFFDGYKFATQGSDSNNHYVVKRTVTTEVDLGTITTVQNDPDLYKTNKENREIWVQGTPGAQSRLLLEMIGDRLTDGVTEASLSYILNANKTPALYIGKSWTNLTEIEVRIPLDSITDKDESVNEDYSNLVGDIIYVPEFYIEKNINLVDSTEFVDGLYYFGVNVEDYIPPTNIEILKTTGQLPPSLYDISSLPKVLKSDEAELNVTGTYLYDKSKYQRFFGTQYMTAQVVEEQIGSVTYSILPFSIQGVEIIGDELVIRSIPAVTEFKLITNLGGAPTLVFSDYSFTKRVPDTYGPNNVDYHVYAPGDEPWERIETDVNPWMDEVFTSGSKLRPAVLYSCSCPNYSHTILAAPQATEDEGTRKINRQRRYPLPTVLGKFDYEAIGLNQVAGKAESWETREHQMSFKMCKHTIAAMFIEKLKVQEPSSYPSIESRLKFEEKLEKDIGAVVDKFNASYQRGGITALEIVFALAQGLNLSDTETAYVLFNNNF